MHDAWIWAAAALAYGAFRGWYDGPRRPLRADEIERYLAQAAALPTAEHNDLATLRAFLEADDGREFVMLNLVRVAPGEAADPATGALRPARELLDHYSRKFMPALLRRGGHPAFVARKVGGYVDAWRVAPDPGWSIVGFMRYRSRRDLMELVVDPRFGAIHGYKLAGTAETFSFPTQRMLSTFAGPRIWAALGLALVAALLT